ncbi:MAG: hypothetical protein K0R89_455 [Ramlibacter sp.]|jgi:hypothetical protein|nr:hypothetical protein [Ramlibacter sp.]
MKIEALGQAAAHPRVAEMLAEAKALRETANSLLRELIALDRQEREEE